MSKNVSNGPGFVWQMLIHTIDGLNDTMQIKKKDVILFL